MEFALIDNPLIYKLTFFKSIAAEVKPFLTEFQTDKPVAPFLFESISKMIKNIMRKFVKAETIKEAKSLKYQRF